MLSEKYLLKDKDKLTELATLEVTYRKVKDLQSDVSLSPQLDSLSGMKVERTEVTILPRYWKERNTMLGSFKIITEMTELKKFDATGITNLFEVLK